MINENDVMRIGRSVARATKSSMIEDEISGVEISFYTEGLKIGGEDDNDSNDSRVFNVIIKRAKEVMSSNYPNVKYQIESAEKGYWSMMIGDDNAKV